jgi:hypothetical protein
MKSFAYSRYFNIAMKSGADRHECGASMPKRSQFLYFRHPLSCADAPLKSTIFYYPAKLIELLSTAAMIMIRTSTFTAVRVAAALRMQALT